MADDLAQSLACIPRKPKWQWERVVFIFVGEGGDLRLQTSDDPDGCKTERYTLTLGKTDKTFKMGIEIAKLLALLPGCDYKVTLRKL